MTLDQKGKELLAECEGLKLKPYLCSKGVATIGLGNTFYEDGKAVKLSNPPITKERAYQLFDSIKVQFEKAINDSVKVPLKQQQFNGLFLFVYNVGISAFKKSELLKQVNSHSGDVENITKCFMNWKGKTKNSKGEFILESRRKKEINEYFRK